jgi:hypothetical protein
MTKIDPTQMTRSWNKDDIGEATVEVQITNLYIHKSFLFVIIIKVECTNFPI